MLLLKSPHTHTHTQHTNIENTEIMISDTSETLQMGPQQQLQLSQEFFLHFVSLFELQTKIGVTFGLLMQ